MIFYTTIGLKNRTKQHKVKFGVPDGSCHTKNIKHWYHYTYHTYGYTYHNYRFYPNSLILCRSLP